MTLQQITVSLELAQQLKEAEYPQESLFYWFSNNKKTEYWVMRAHREHFTEQGWKDLMDIVIAAPTASELGEQLPQHIAIKQQAFRLTIDVDSNKRFYANYLAYKNKNTLGNNCDLSVFEPHEKTDIGIHEDAFYQIGTHVGGSKSLSETLGNLWLYLKKQGLLTSPNQA